MSRRGRRKTTTTTTTAAAASTMKKELDIKHGARVSLHNDARAQGRHFVLVALRRHKPIQWCPEARAQRNA